MGVIVEKFHDERGIIWPDKVAPYQIHLIGLDLKDKNIRSKVHQVYQDLLKNNIEVLFDDRENTSPGEKFSDADLIGIPHRAVISKRTQDKIEYKARSESKFELLTYTELMKKIK